MTAILDDRPVALLSPRQWDIFTELMTDGATNAAIAKRLFVSEDTVKTHMKTILQKTNCATRTELMARVFREQVRVQRKVS